MEVARLITFPSTAKDDEIIVIRCGTGVTRKGEISNVVYTNPAHAAVFRPYEDAALSAFLVAGAAGKTCVRGLTDVLLASKYIPAQYGSKAVEGTYVEAWYTVNFN